MESLLDSITQIKNEINSQQYSEILRDFDHARKNRYFSRKIPVWNGKKVKNVDICVEPYNWHSIILSSDIIKISDELGTFLEIPRGVIITVDSVIDSLDNYIKNKNLRTDSGKINIDYPDAQELRNILRINNINSDVTIFNVGEYLKQHYI
jgi:hypothetical protein